MAILAGLYSVASKINISYPIVLVMAGLGISLIPGLPVVQITPEIVFLLFLPPLLFDAARHTSWHDFKKHSDSIGRLAIGLVLFTTAGVAVCAYYMIPGFTWPLAFVLGAIVSPPDAVAATSAIKGLRLPKRLVAILEGESLVNDATALIAYRYAVVAVASGGAFVLWQAALEFVLVAAGGAIIGAAIGFVFTWALKKLFDNPIVETILTLILPFVSYIAAEHAGVSGVLSVVATGLVVSWRAHEIFSFQTRMQMNGFWETLIFLLNGFVFILIGLELPVIVNDVQGPLSHMIGYGLLISAVVIVIRLIWIFPTVRISDWLRTRRGIIVSDKTNGQLFILGWSGMRGVISLATALALPLVMDNGEVFPQRGTILFITFVVILVTLVFQGLTLPLLIKWLGVSETEEREMLEERRLRQVLVNSTLSFVNETLAPRLAEPALAEVQGRLERQARYLDGTLADEGARNEDDLGQQRELFAQYLESEHAVIAHQRALLIQMHKKGAFSEEVLKRIEQDLDSRSLTLEGRKQAYR